MRVALTWCALGFIMWIGAVTGEAGLRLALAAADEPKQEAINEDDANAAQRAWCDGLIKIGKVHEEGGDYKSTASQFIDDLYDYKEGKVFFKPTMAFGKNTFRNTKEAHSPISSAATRIFQRIPALPSKIG